MDIEELVRKQKEENAKSREATKSYREQAKRAQPIEQHAETTVSESYITKLSQVQKELGLILKNHQTILNKYGYKIDMTMENYRSLGDALSGKSERVYQDEQEAYEREQAASNAKIMQGLRDKEVGIEKPDFDVDGSQPVNWARESQAMDRWRQSQQLMSEGKKEEILRGLELRAGMRGQHIAVPSLTALRLSLSKKRLLGWLRGNKELAACVISSQFADLDACAKIETQLSLIYNRDFGLGLGRNKSVLNRSPESMKKILDDLITVGIKNDDQL